MTQPELLAVILVVIVIWAVGLTTYLPLVLLNRFVFLFIDERRDWVRVLRRSIGPELPPRGATRRVLLQVAGRWFYLVGLGSLALVLEAAISFLIPGNLGGLVIFLMVPVTSAFVFIGLVDLVILLVRCLFPRRRMLHGQQSTYEATQDKKPPNYTLHPSSGIGLGADFVRRLARRG
jgi:hypothetical protein